MRFFAKLFRLASSAGKFSNYTNHVFSKGSSNALFKIIITRNWPRKTLTMTGSTAAGILGFMKKTEEEEDPKLTSREILLAKADALFDQSEYKKAYELLNNYRDNKDAEILWRLCRILYHLSKSASDVEARKMIFDAYDLSTTALNIDENHSAVQKWMAIMLDLKNKYIGTKARISESLVVKKHMERAAELNPKDATIYYMLGSWCFQMTDLAWYQRKIASAIFATPPESSFEEALGYFETAEKVDPNFYSHNLLMLGKTYLKLNRREDGIKYLKLAADYDAKNDDDLEAKKEAVKMLNKLGVKTQ